LKTTLLHFRSFENRIVGLYTLGVEVGDINHSKNFAPYVVDTMYDVIRRKVVKSLTTENPLQFPLPIHIIIDKDQSRFR
jgi:hypothetical protein